MADDLIGGLGNLLGTVVVAGVALKVADRFLGGPRQQVWPKRRKVGKIINKKGRRPSSYGIGDFSNVGY